MDSATEATRRGPDRPGLIRHVERPVGAVTPKGEPFRAHDVSLNSLSDLIVEAGALPEPLRQAQPRRESLSQ
jgi:hypothetical protein